MPDGVEPDTRIQSAFEEWAKGEKIPQKDAQRYVDAYVKITQVQQEAWQETINGWAEKAKQDEFFGRKNFEQNVVAVQQHVAQFGDPELRSLLNDMGIGNHPAVLRYMLRVSKATSEGRAPVAAATTSPEKPDPAQVLYGNRNAGSS